MGGLDGSGASMSISEDGAGRGSVSVMSAFEAGVVDWGAMGSAMVMSLLSGSKVLNWEVRELRTAIFAVSSGWLRGCG